MNYFFLSMTSDPIERFSMKRRNLTVPVLCWLVVALFAVGGCQGEKVGGPASGAKRGGPGNSVTSVETVSVDRGPLSVVGDYAGEFQSEGSSQLSADTAGRVILVEANIGDVVRRGQVLAEIDPLPHQQRIRELQASDKMAKASLAESKVQLENMKVDLARRTPLLERKMITAAEIQNLEAGVLAAEQRVAVADATIGQNRARLQSAQEDLRNTKITAPFDGRIAERFVDLGTYVTPNQPVFRVIDDSEVYLRVRLPERDSGLVSMGMPVEVRIAAFGSKPQSGKIHRIAPALDPATRSLRVDIVLDEELAALKPGMYARVQFVLGQRDDALSVPNRALFKERDGTPFVWLVKDDKANKATIVPGLEGRERTEVLEGLSAGDAIVLRGHERLRPDATVLDLAKSKDSSQADSATRTP